jgi:hypothetical protein
MHSCCRTGSAPRHPDTVFRIRRGIKQPLGRTPRYNVAMAGKAEKKHRETVQTPSTIVNHHRFLTPEENAELMDSLRYDDFPAAADYDPEYNS